MSTHSRQVIVLRASQAAFTQAGRVFLVLSVPWAFVALVASDSLLNAVGLSAGERSFALRLCLVVVAFGPVLVAMLHRPISGLPGFRWLLESPQPSAHADERGLELALPGKGVRRFTWSEITDLVPVQAAWFSTMHGELRGGDGATLATIPYSLMHPRAHWGTFRTLAQAIAEANPARYVLADHNAFGIAYGFTLRGSPRARPEVLHAARRRRLNVRLVAWGVMSAVALAAGAVLLMQSG